MSRSIPRTTCRLEGRGVDQILEDDDRTEVRVETEPRTQSEETPLRPDAVIEGFPLRTADGAQQDGVARLREFHDLIGKGGSVAVVSGAADQAPLPSRNGRRPVRRRSRGPSSPPARSRARCRRRGEPRFDISSFHAPRTASATSSSSTRRHPSVPA